MKLKLFFLSIMFVVLFIVPFDTLAQIGIDNGNIWVIAITPDVKSSNNTHFTNNTDVNKLFSKYKVTTYRKALPFAKTPELQNVYEISCNGDVTGLLRELQNNFKDQFSKVRLLEYQNIALYDPDDYMWTIHADDWLWHLKKIQADLAWDISKGDTSVKVAIIDTDFDITHPDLATKISPNLDPYDSIVYDCDLVHSHGTIVASFVAAETTEHGEPSMGQLPSVGFNTMFMGYKAWSGNYLQRALHASTVMNADIITSSAGGWTYCPDTTGVEKLIVKEILNNGTTIIMPAGNGDNGTHNFCPAVDSNNHCAFFPLSPYYDERIIIVSSTGIDDKHTFTNNPNNTHSHYPGVDLCAPGYQTMGAVPTECGDNTWPYYGSCSGTSFATPIVAGVAALMYAENPCLSPSLCQDILKNTTDSILDADLYPNGVGTGRVNAYKAVLSAKNTYSSDLDLFIKDRPEDFGVSGGYHWQARRDQSPDIWVRNQPDGYTNQISQEPEYQSEKPVYVYVKVRNKSCQDSYGDEVLSLYWSKASSWSSWPQNWDGSQPTIGNVIGSVNIGTLPAGRDTIVEFVWNIINPHIYENWATCLLARIENSTVDPITIYPDRLDDDVFFNNNIALRNITIVDVISDTSSVIINQEKCPYGKFILIGNPTNKDETYNFLFSTLKSKNKKLLNEIAEIKIHFNDKGWNLLEKEIRSNKNLLVVKNKEVKVIGSSTFLKNLTFPAHTRIPIYVSFKFLTENVSHHEDYYFDVQQYLSNNESVLGGELFIVRKPQNRKSKNMGYKSVFGEENTAWNIKTAQLFGDVTDSIVYIKDTMIMNKNYKQVDYYRLHSKIATFFVYEDIATGKLVYRPFDDSENAEEYLIYDMALNMGDLVDNHIVDSVYYKNGSKYIRFNYFPKGADNEKFTMIEGVGTNIGLMYHNSMPGCIDPYLLCHVKDDSAVFVNQHSVYQGNCNVENVGIIENNKRELTVFPNPVSKTLHISCDNISEIHQILIKDINGRTVKKVTSEFENISIGNLCSGTYFVTIYFPESVLIRKIIVCPRNL